MSEETFSGAMPDSMVDELFADVPTGDTADTSTETPADGDNADTGDVTDSAPDLDAPASPEAPEESDAEPPLPEEAKPTPEATDTPEGATMRERNGKKEYVFPEERGKTVYAGYKLAQEAESLLGEPLTREALQARQNAHEWLETQKIEFVSPDPNDQANVFQNMFREAATALANGEIGHDPLETVGESFLTTLQATAPEHYERAERFVMNGVLDKLYQAAAESKSEKLLRTVQNLDHHFNGKYTRDEELTKRVPDAMTRREQDLAQREQRIQQHQQRQAQARWNNWHNTTKSTIGESVKTVIASQIPEAIQQAFSKMPNGSQRIENVKQLLDLEVKKAIQGDQNWRQQNANLFKQAEMAPSEQRRQAIAQQIVQRYEQRARQVLAAKAKQILDAETLSLKQANAATHQRQQAAANQKGAVGGSRPPARSIPGSVAAEGSWEDFVEAAFK